MNWYQPEIEKKKEKDYFLLGLIPALIIPISIYVLLISQMTEMSVFVVLQNPQYIHNIGIQKLMASSLPDLVLLFVFYMLKKEKASVGAFVGTIPYLILMFWVF